MCCTTVVEEDPNFSNPNPHATLTVWLVGVQVSIRAECFLPGTTASLCLPLEDPLRSGQVRSGWVAVGWAPSFLPSRPLTAIIILGRGCGCQGAPAHRRPAPHHGGRAAAGGGRGRGRGGPGPGPGPPRRVRPTIIAFPSLPFLSLADFWCVCVSVCAAAAVVGSSSGGGGRRARSAAAACCDPRPPSASHGLSPCSRPTRSGAHSNCTLEFIYTYIYTYIHAAAAAGRVGVGQRLVLGGQRGRSAHLILAAHDGSSYDA